MQIQCTAVKNLDSVQHLSLQTLIPFHVTCDVSTIVSETPSVVLFNNHENKRAPELDPRSTSPDDWQARMDERGLL